MLNILSKNYNYILIWIFLLFVIIFSLISYFKISSYEYKVNLSKQQIKTNKIKTNIDIWMGKNLQIIDELANELTYFLKQNKNFFDLSKEEIFALSSQNNAKPRLQFEYLINRAQKSSNSMQTYMGFENSLILYNDGSNQPKEYNLKNRSWYQEAIRKQGPFVSNIFIGSSSNQYTINFSSPIFIENKIYGVASLSFLINSIYEIIQKTNIENGYAFVVNSQGKIIAHPNKDKINKSLQDGTLINEDLYKKLQEKNNGAATYFVENGKMQVTFEKLDNGFFIVVVTQQRLLNSFSIELLKLMLISGILLLLLMGVINYKIKQAK